MTGGAGLRLQAQLRGTTLLLQLGGNFEWSNVGNVEGALEEAQHGEIEHIVFDLRHVTFLDMAGLAALMRAHERGAGEGYDVRVVPPTGRARRVFTLTRAGAVLNLVHDVDDLPHPGESPPPSPARGRARKLPQRPSPVAQTQHNFASDL